MKVKLPDFDVLADLARHQPDQLEALRQKLTDTIIDGATSEQQRKRLEGLKFRVDMERERAGSPLAATIRISELMAQSLNELHRAMVTPFARAEAPAASAKVLAFRNPNEEPAQEFDNKPQDAIAPAQAPVEHTQD